MDTGEFFRPIGSALRRYSHLILPGFATVWMLHKSDSYASDFTADWLTDSWGQFFALIVVLVPAVLVAGLFIQAFRMATFDLIRKLWRPAEPDPDSPHALHYAVYANLAIVWPAAFMVKVIDHGWAARTILLLVVFEVALVWAAMCNYGKSIKAPTRRKTTKKR